MITVLAGTMGTWKRVEYVQLLWEIFLSSYETVEAPPGTVLIALHRSLYKSQTALSIQLRTGKDGLNAIQYQARVYFAVVREETRQ